MSATPNKRHSPNKAEQRARLLAPPRNNGRPRKGTKPIEIPIAVIAAPKTIVPINTNVPSQSAYHSRGTGRGPGYQTWLARKKGKFLTALRELHLRGEAASAIGVDRNTIWGWERNDPAFREAVQECEELSTQELEEVAERRAKERSDILLMFLLNARRPQRYAHNARVVTETRKAPADLSMLDDTTLARMIAMLDE